MTWGEFIAKVRATVTDLEPSNEDVVLAVYNFVKAEIAREVDGEVELHRSYRADYRRIRNRLLGFRHTYGSASALKTQVLSVLPVDATRANLATFNDRMMDMAIRQIEGYNSFVMQTIRHTVLELQDYIAQYRLGHETLYTHEMVSDHGNASHGVLPEGAYPREVYVLAGDFEADPPTCCRTKIETMAPWSRRIEDMVLEGKCAPVFVIDPTGHLFWVTPKLEVDDDGNEVRMLVNWDGTKLEFIDTDKTPFDEQMARVAGFYLMAEMARRDGENISTINSHMAAYNSGKTKLWLFKKDQGSLNEDQ